MSDKKKLTHLTPLTLGSLFDGSGGFPLAGILAGIKPVWASEVSSFPILVTQKRLPQVKHYGDVSKLKGSELEPVDIITFGSPCQDLSIAGKRAGLTGERSGLYMQAVRIIKEMLEATNREYPKFCVFENVPGLLSSNQGNDFVACLDMLQELGFIPDVNILDAQYMGVPQRRKRVFITWLNVDYILSRKTNISDCIILQLFTEILLLRLGELLKVLGTEQKNLDVNELSRCEDGLKKRMWNGMTCYGFSSRKYQELESRVSDILMSFADKKFYLSPKACQGILNRAASRGKELPPVLKRALEVQAGSSV